jgi:hypothetical protein
MPGSTCRVCGQYHPELCMHYGPVAPVYWFAIPEAEATKATRLCKLSGMAFVYSKGSAGTASGKTGD